jgi:chondroitin 4-sulfotransferase 11
VEIARNAGGPAAMPGRRRNSPQTSDQSRNNHMPWKSNISKLMQWRMRLADLRGRGIYAGYPNRHRCIFIHIPKTAGFSIALSLFGEHPWQHATYREYEMANSKKFLRYFKFAFVRNPWDRLVSGYFYMRSGPNDEDRKGNREWYERHLARYRDFGGFVRGWLTRESIWTEPFQPQYHFVCDENRHVRMDFVGRVETIEADFRHICERLNISAQLTQVNTSDHRHYTEYYTDDLRERVAALYAEDIEIFGYRFDGAPARCVG